MKPLWLTPEAERDLTEAHLWYSRQRRGLVDQFLRSLDRCFVAVARRPEAYQLIDRNVRRALLRRFPYAVFFEPMPTGVVVYAVFHCARDPQSWKRETDA